MTGLGTGFSTGAGVVVDGAVVATVAVVNGAVVTEAGSTVPSGRIADSCTM
jgi:hypothetical protein